MGKVKNGVWSNTAGLQLQLKKVPIITARAAIKKLKEPVVPIVFDENKQRSEPNASDPDYRKALEEYQMEVGFRMIDTYLMFGVEVLAVPVGMFDYKDAEWQANLEDLGIDQPKSERGKFITWLKYHALDDDEFREVHKEVMRYSGIVLQEDVKNASDEFPSDEVRPVIDVVPIARKG